MKKNAAMNLSEETAKHLNLFSSGEEKADAQMVPDPTKPIQVPLSILKPVIAPPCPDIHVKAVSRTDVGLVRRVNQDAVLVAPPLYGIADGMGGHKGGEIASAACRDGLIGFLEGKGAEANLLETAVKVVNRRIFIQASEDESLSGMGTTLTAAWFGASEVFIAHVGDSRCYLLRDGKLAQITQDHSMVMEMVRAGMLTREQAETHPMRNVITRAIGSDRAVDVDVTRLARHFHDVWLICSDGLHGQVSEERIQAILTEMPPEEAADQLIRETLENGAPDNVSFVLLVDEDGEGTA